ncbi:MAG: TatD family hydrolase [Candidatus Woesearchaeota archaeon]
MKFIDVHFHPDYFKDEELKLIDLSQTIAIGNSISSKNHQKIIDFSKKWKNYYVALGIYPEEAKDEEITILKEFLVKENVIAIGEVGLDGSFNNLDNQIRIFREIIKLSKKYDLPLIVHSRKAEKIVVELLCEEKVKGVLHYFNGKFSLAAKLQESGIFLTIPSNVINNQHFQKFVRELKLDLLLPETDSPFLHPLKDWPNVPQNVKFAYEFLSKEKNIPLELVQKIFLENFKTLFRISPC